MVEVTDDLLLKVTILRHKPKRIGKECRVTVFNRTDFELHNNLTA